MKAVIFDMDGVLIDSEPLHYRIERELFKELGFDLSDQEHQKFQGIGGHEMFTELKRRFGLRDNVANLVGGLRGRYLELLKAEGIPLIPGVFPLAAELSKAGRLLAVASSSPLNQIDLVLDSVRDGVRLGSYFSARVSGDEVARGKPDPLIFLTAAERLGVEPKSCWVIEDSENGIRAARAAGMTCIAYDNPSCGLQNLSAAHYRVNSLDKAGKLILVSAGV